MKQIDVLVFLGALPLEFSTARPNVIESSTIFEDIYHLLWKLFLQSHRSNHYGDARSFCSCDPRQNSRRQRLSERPWRWSFRRTSTISDLLLLSQGARSHQVQFLTIARKATTACLSTHVATTQDMQFDIRSSVTEEQMKEQLY